MSRPLSIALALLAVAAGPPTRETVDTLTLGEFTLELEATWERLTDTTYGFERQYPLIRDLRPAAKRAVYGADAFRPFLPPDGLPPDGLPPDGLPPDGLPPDGLLEPGRTWRLDAADALPFLRQLHPGATVDLHQDGGLGLGVSGAWACLRVLDADWAEVELRVHAEFLLEGDGSLGSSSWFTPAQFAGRMVVDRRRGKVVAFRLEVPQQRANVDLNVAEDGRTVADIGRVPRLELAGGTFPTYAPDAAQISEREARDLLQRAFYPFAAIDWLELPRARAASLASGKPLHVIALFGSLTDESC